MFSSPARAADPAGISSLRRRSLDGGRGVGGAFFFRRFRRVPSDTRAVQTITPIVGTVWLGVLTGADLVFQQRWESHMHGVSISAGPPSFNGRDSQPSATSRNETQRGQRDFGGVAEVREPYFVDLQLIRVCRDELDAVNLCIDLSRLTDEVLCERLGIDKGHFSRIRKGRAHFPTAKRIALCWLAGNWAPLQYEMWKTDILRRLEEAQNQQPRFA